MSIMFQKTAILGPGLMGASLMRALRERGLTDHLTAWSRREETRLKCRGQSWCDAVYSSPELAIRGAELVVVCLPVEHVVPLLSQIGPTFDVGCLITDVGSTKSQICRQVPSLLPEGVDFVGSHPMVGSEKTGPENAYSTLFQGGACFVTPQPETPQRVVQKATDLWEALDMNVGTTSPERHDEIVASISHLPHFLASVLCAYLAKQDPCLGDFVGAGLRDTTRIAAGDPYLWKSIASQNREAILQGLEGFDQELHRFRLALEAQNWSAVIDLLERGKAYRDGLR